MLKNYDIRAFIDSRSEKTGKKIRDAEIKKVPYMIIIGEKEEKSTKCCTKKSSGRKKKKRRSSSFA